MVTLKGNYPNTPLKGKVVRLDKKARSNYMLSTETHFKYKDPEKSKEKDMPWRQ